MKERELIKNKFNGRCAYCGEVLKKGWHIDHIIPVRRNPKPPKYNLPQFVLDSTPPTNETPEPEPPLMINPENDTLDNKFPSCPSCNINKHQESIEGFRGYIKQYVQSLNEYSTQYKIAKKYGLIEETNKPVVFYFEKLNSKPKRKGL